MVFNRPLSYGTDELYTLVASDGERHAMLISNLTGKKQELNITGVDLSFLFKSKKILKKSFYSTVFCSLYFLGVIPVSRLNARVK